jgi:hypothetical protein
VRASKLAKEPLDLSYFTRTLNTLFPLSAFMHVFYANAKHTISRLRRRDSARTSPDGAAVHRDGMAASTMSQGR